VGQQSGVDAGPSTPDGGPTNEPRSNDAPLVADDPAVPVVVATLLRPSGGTGVQTHFAEFMRFLRAEDVPASLVTPFSCGGIGRDAAFGIRRVVAQISGSADVAWYRFGHVVFLQQALRRQLAALDDAVVYCQCPVSALAALRTRRSSRQKVVLAVHFAVSQADEWVGKGLIPRDGRVFRSIRALERRVFDRVDGVVFVSESARQDLWIGEVDVPTATIPNFLAAKPVPAATARRADLMSIGGLEPRKNHRFLLDTLAAAKRRGRRYTLDIAGSGPEERNLLDQAEALGIDDQVRLLGYVSEAGNLVAGYRAYAHSAKSEVFGLALIEAMAAGVPVVAPPVGGIPTLFDDPVEGRFWDLGDPDGAAAILIELLDDEPARARMGAAARRRFVDHYDAATVCPELLEFLTSVTSQPAPAGAGGGASAKGSATQGLPPPA
jgi:glycosyltransferase involved in cell wall biosynthesis